MSNNQTVKILINVVLVIGAGVLIFFLVNSNMLSGDIITWGFLILVLVFMVVGFVYNAWAGKKRKEALQQISQEMGYAFLLEDKDFNGQIMALSQFEIFNKGRNRKAYNILRGQKRDAQAVVFDYKYTTGGGRSSQTHHLTLAMLTLEQPELVQFSLRPRGLFDKVASKFGQREISFESVPEFSKRYLVKGIDEEAVRRLFNLAVTSFFEQQNNISCEADANRLLVYRSDKTVKPDELRAYQDSASQLLELMRRPTYSFDYAR